jgi:hypothetical protein
MSLEIVRYRTKTSYCPIDDYFKKYNVYENDKLQQKKLKTFAKIEWVIKAAANNKGIVGGQFSAPVAGYDFQEFRIKEGDNLVRILYFCYFRDKLVLLDGFDKPDRYEKGKKKRIEKMIDEKYNQAQKYYEDFLKNPQNYEKYK